MFDPEAQHDRPRAKIVAALERLSRVFRVLLWEEARPRGLSPIQGQILVFLRHHRAPLRRVGQLADEFAVTPATVSDAVSTLEGKGLLTKRTWDADRRVSILELTPEGASRADELAGWADVVHRRLDDLSDRERDTVLGFLIGTIASLERAGVLSAARMCPTCRFFGESDGDEGGPPYYCHLLERPLGVADLRVDCPEHEASREGVGIDGAETD